jgi:DNA modification methylase
LNIFAGSCSAAEAALKTGRKFTGVDLKKDYLDEAINGRLDKYINNTRLAGKEAT